MPQPQQLLEMDETQEMDENVSGTLSPGSESATNLLLPGAKLRGPQPPPLNPLQFIKVSPPVNLYKAPPPRELPPVERIRKEEPEDWQNDLEGWKVNRRKRQEQLMERVSEIKKSEEEQSNPSSRKNKTFSEMMRGRKCSIVVHNDEDNDLSDLGIGSKPQNEEENEEDKIMVCEKENEFTYEKAIQNYVEFASSRVSKPVISTSTITQTNEINVTTITSSSETTETDQWEENCVQQERTIILPNETPSIAQPMKKKEIITSPQTHIPSSQPIETRNSVQEKSSLFEKISVFEKPVEIKTSKLVETKQSKPKEDTPTTPTKKSRPPVPAKPRATALKEESPCVSFHQTITTESLPQQTMSSWNNIMSAAESDSCVSRVSETSSEMIFTSSSVCSSDLRLQQTLEQTSKEEPSLVFSDDSSNIDMELSPTSSSAGVPGCTSSLKLMEPSVANSGLDHVNARDIQRSPLGGEDSGVHTADSVSQSDEVEEEEELPSQTNLEMSAGLLGILTSQTPIELSALLAPPSQLEPPREKPPPPPPVGLEPDTETMRKSFLGLEMAPPPSVPAFESLSAENSETDCLGTQLKERLLRLEEEKNNIRNMEKQIKAEKLTPHAAKIAPAIKDSAGNQENLAREREALRIEREAIASRKQAAFAKKLAVRSLDSLDIPPQHEIEAPDDRVFFGQGTGSNNNNNNNMNNNNDMKLNHHHHPQISQDDSYLSKSVEKESMSQYFHQPMKQHSVDELQVSYEHQHSNDLISQSDNFNLPIRKSQSEDHLLNHQSIQQPYPSPPKQTMNDRSPNHASPHEQQQQQHHFSKQYQSKQHENGYQQNVPHPKISPEYPPSQPYYTPPSPRYEVNNKHFYEDTQYFEPQPNEPAAMPAMPVLTSPSHGSWNKQPNYIQPAAQIRKKGPPPPAKPSRIPQQQHHLTRNYSADSILESVDGDAPVPLRRNKPGNGVSNGANGRSSMPYNIGGSMSQLPNQHSLQPQPRQRPTSTQGINYQHWLVQEAEHRRITEHQQRQAAANPRQPKHLPDAIIMSLTQRVQQRQSQIPQRTSPQRTTVEDKVLSVSGKKKCSHCNLELGRGAAMIIESLRLFYHIDCFKCCVCCIQLGDGLMGTDVRVRNGKLHCHSCYSSDDGVKFSCV